MSYVGWAWLVVIVACLIIEAFTMGLTTIWFAVGAFIAWITYFIGLGNPRPSSSFLIVSTLCLIMTRPLVVKKLKVGKTRTNADSLIGEKAKVESTINNINNEGTVKIRGQVWSAKSFKDDIIEKDEIVLVKDIKGVKLIVEKIE